MFASAFVSNTTVRDALINGVYNHANFNLSAGVFPERYNTSDNSPSNGFARSVLVQSSRFLNMVVALLCLTPFLPALQLVACSPTSPSRKLATLIGNYRPQFLNMSSRSVPNQTISGSPSDGQQTSGSRSSSNVGAIVGGVVGGLAIIGLAVAIYVVRLRKRRRWQDESEVADTSEVTELAQNRPTFPSYHLETDTLVVSSPSDAKATLAVTGANGGDVEALSSDPAGKADREMTAGRTPPQSAPSELDATASIIGSQTGSTSSRNLLSRMGSISTTDVVGIRAEVNNLWRVMQEIRQERLEPPPGYAE